MHSLCPSGCKAECRAIRACCGCLCQACIEGGYAPGLFCHHSGIREAALTITCWQLPSESNDWCMGMFGINKRVDQTS
eukprot:scaffold243595_cov30-Prasinocladus_malaysianus.AAC.1